MYIVKYNTVFACRADSCNSFFFVLFIMKAVLLILFVVGYLAAGHLLFNENDWGELME